MKEYGQMNDWFPFPTIRVFKSQKKAARYYKTMTGGELEKIREDKLALVKWLTNDKSCESLAIVVIDAKQLKNDSTAQLYGIIAHECSHIVDHIMDDLGEDCPGGEFRAYSLQCAMMAVVEQLGEEWLTRPVTNHN